MTTSPQKKRKSRFRFTWNNYPKNHRKLLESILEITFIVYGQETGAQGTPHLQGYLEIGKKEKTITALQKVFKKAKIGLTILVADLDALDNTLYCIKEANVCVNKWGKPFKQGKRTDLITVGKYLKVHTLDETAVKFQREFIKFHGGLSKLKEVFNRMDSKSWRNIETSVFHGKAGRGKTRLATDVIHYYKLNEDSSTVWWDGYMGEKTLIIDDFDGWISYNRLLGLLDGYQCRLAIKGGFTYARWTKVIITSNYAPKEWFSQGLTEALKRRLHVVIDMSTPVSTGVEGASSK